MKIAVYKQEQIKMDSLSADRIQHIYDLGKKNLLTCPDCGNTVKMYLGIMEPPHFYHSSDQTKECHASQTSSQDQIKEDYVIRDGFRYPSSRAVTTDVNSFKTIKRIGGNPSFSPNVSQNTKAGHDYLDALLSAGVQLDDEQLAAVRTTEGPLLVLSGAGSGKTRVLTARTAFLMKACDVSPGSILLVTFTAKAAKEMKTRLESYPDVSPQDVQALVAGTFHSIFYKILMFHERNRWNGNNLMKFDWEKEQLIKQAGRERGLDDKEFAYDAALQQIGLWKNSLLYPDDVRTSSSFEEDCLFLYRRYESAKQQSGRFDFDDMLIGCHRLFKEQPEILDKYKGRFRYILIDEFQDINKVQYELIKMLSGANICVVGDDDQSIYAFRGSDPSFILDFEKDFPKAQVITLTQNYRSSHQIVASANRIIAKNERRKQKKMQAQYDNGLTPVLFYPQDEEVEATMIVNDILEKVQAGASPSDFAVLYRTHTMSRALFERLAQSNLPFTVDSDAESFYQRRVVKTMLSFLKLSIDEDDVGAIADLLPALFLKSNLLQEVKAQMILQDCSALMALASCSTGHSFQERKLRKLPSQIRSLQNIPPSAALERIEKEIGFQDYVKKRGNEGNKMEKGSDDVRNLKVAAKRFTNSSEFLQHADHISAMNKEIKKLSKHFPEAVSLTTIHRAKGLEYKYVYILSAVDGGLPHDYALDEYRKGNKHALEEERRLMYVAATRAKAELYFSVLQSRGGKTAYPSRFLYI